MRDNTNTFAHDGKTVTLNPMKPKQPKRIKEGQVSQKNSFKHAKSIKAI